MKDIKVTRSTEPPVEGQEAPESGITPMGALCAVRDAIRAHAARQAQWEEYMQAEKKRMRNELGLSHLNMIETIRFMGFQPGVREYLQAELEKVKTKTVKISGPEVQYGIKQAGGNTLEITDEQAVAKALLNMDGDEVRACYSYKTVLHKPEIKALLKGGVEVDGCGMSEPTVAPVFKVAGLDVAAILEAQDDDE